MARSLKPDDNHWWYDSMALYERVRAQMNVRGLKFREAAEEIGINFTTISKLRTREPSIQTVTRLCQWLQIPIDTFIRREGPKRGLFQPTAKRRRDRLGLRTSG